MNPVFNISGEIEEGKAAELGAFLAGNPAPVSIVINSPGGIASEGAALMAAMQRHGKCHVTVEGIAASAASLAVMGGQKITMHRAALLMIHDPRGFTFGVAADHRATAATLEKMSETYAAAYARATGHPVVRIAKWMTDETWMTAEEALHLNFSDEIEADPAQEVLASAFDYSQFQNTPNSMLRLVRASGWATVSPDKAKENRADA